MLYTSIPIGLGLETTSYRLSNKSNLILNHFSNNFILEALELILRNNNFKFDKIFYNQTEGTVMRTRFAPMLASRL